MKKLFAVVASALFSFCIFSALPAIASGVDYNGFTLSAVGTNTVSGAQVIYGEVRAVSVSAPAGATGTVTVATADGQTIFSKASITGTSVFNVRGTAVNYAGTAITAVDGGSNTNSYVVPFALGGVSTTCTVTQTSTTTNTWKISVIKAN